MALEIKRDSFKQYILWSIGAHIGLLLILTVKNMYFPSSVNQYMPTVKVDLIALPDKQIQQIKNKNKKSLQETKNIIEKANSKSKAPKVNLKKKKSKKLKQKRALEKLKAQNAIDALKKELQPPKKQKFKGNVLSAGTQLTGINKLQHDDYQGEIDNHVKQYWELPEWLAQAELKALALVKLNSQGYVIENKILRSSGNPEYDEVVLNTIQRASPFPPPTKKFVDIVKVDGITLGFPE